MFIGHYGVALGAKRLAPRTSLGTLAFAAQFLDELWPVLLLVGVEQVRVVPGLMAANPLDFAHYPWSHSLLMAIVWAVLVGVVYRLLRRDHGEAWVVAAAVLSHWFLDLPMHRPDLPLWPGASPKLGLGAWNSIPLTVLLDGGLFVLGLAVYLRTTRAADRVGTWALWAMVAVLVLIFAGGFAGPPPDAHAIALSGLGLWLFVPWSWWIDRHRVLRSSAEDVEAVAAPA